MNFKERYGPWALVAGASEGIGRAFAHRVAREGLNCILVARREPPLAELAAELQREYGVDTLVVTGDLSAADVAQKVAEAAGQREIGLFIHNAGTDPVGSRFFEADVEEWQKIANLNVSTMVGLTHSLGLKMKARQRGGIVIVGSGACYGGSTFTSVYSGGKAFEMCFAEGIWAELRGHGVHALYCALGPTDTPAFRDLMRRKNSQTLPGLASPADVADQVLAQLPNGPVMNWGLADDERGYLPSSAAERRQRVLMIDEGSKRIYGEV